MFDTKFKNNPNCPNATSWKHFQIHSKYSFGAVGSVSFHIFVNFPFFPPKFQKNNSSKNTMWSLKHILIRLDKTFMAFFYLLICILKFPLYPSSPRGNLAYSWTPAKITTFQRNAIYIWAAVWNFLLQGLFSPWS